MYLKLFENPTKNYYYTILIETMSIVERSEKGQSQLYLTIYEQLKDIKLNVIDNRFITDWDDINERYTLGAIAINYFDDGDEMRDRLSDIYGGAVHYKDLSD